MSARLTDEGRGMDRGFVEIALASDRNYFRGLAVTACSLARHANAEARLRFHVLHVGLSDEDRSWLAERVRAFHADSAVKFYDMSAADLSEFPAYASSKMPYVRLFLPQLLGDVDYVLYSDVDVLWKDDVCALWDGRREVGLLACVPEMSAGTLRMERKWFEANGLLFDESRYFCTGIALFNLGEIRRRDAFAKVWEFGRTHHGYNCPDQAMLYGTLADEVVILPGRWQTLPRNGVVAGRGGPAVIHYAGETPWRISRTTKMLTDAQLLWFEMCAEVFGETRWRSLRRFYSVREIVLCRAVFLLVFRIPPLHALFRAWLRMTGRGPFEEALR